MTYTAELKSGWVMTHERIGARSLAMALWPSTTPTQKSKQTPNHGYIPHDR